MSRYIAETIQDKVKVAFGFDHCLGYFYELFTESEDSSQDFKVLRRVFSVSGTPTSEISNFLNENIVESDKKKYSNKLERISLDLPI